MRFGNWLTAEEARRTWQSPDGATLKGKRDWAILAVLLGCGLRRRELADLDFKHLQQREEHWSIVDLVGKGGHIRTVPVPDWSGRRDHHRSRTQREHQQLMLDLQRELNRHENILLGRCAELERKLDQQNRTLRYVRRRLT